MDNIIKAMVESIRGDVNRKELIPLGVGNKVCVHKHGNYYKTKNVKLKYFEYDGKSIGMVGKCSYCDKSYYWVF